MGCACHVMIWHHWGLGRGLSGTQEAHASKKGIMYELDTRWCQVVSGRCQHVHKLQVLLSHKPSAVRLFWIAIDCAWSVDRNSLLEHWNKGIQLTRYVHWRRAPKCDMKIDKLMHPSTAINIPAQLSPRLSHKTLVFVIVTFNGVPTRARVLPSSSAGSSSSYRDDKIIKSKFGHRFIYRLQVSRFYEITTEWKMRQTLLLLSLCPSCSSVNHVESSVCSLSTQILV